MNETKTHKAKTAMNGNEKGKKVALNLNYDQKFHKLNRSKNSIHRLFIIWSKWWAKSFWSCFMWFSWLSHCCVVGLVAGFFWLRECDSQYSSFHLKPRHSKWSKIIWSEARMKIISTYDFPMIHISLRMWNTYMIHESFDSY